MSQEHEEMELVVVGKLEYICNIELLIGMQLSTTKRPEWSLSKVVVWHQRHESGMACMSLLLEVISLFEDSHHLPEQLKWFTSKFRQLIQSHSVVAKDCNRPCCASQYGTDKAHANTLSTSNWQSFMPRTRFILLIILPTSKTKVISRAFHQTAPTFSSSN